MTKFYYIQYTITCCVTKRIQYTDCVSDKHPLEWLKFFRFFSDTWNIRDWKEISEEDYKHGVKTVGKG